MLIEEYRPTVFDDFIGHVKIVEQIKKQIKNKNFQHQLFYGSAGLGKTALSHIIARELYGSAFKKNFFEFNASMDRGIDIVRGDIANLAKRSMGFGKISFKIIFLDEADSLTKDAQHALRRLLEQYHKTTIFIISCNYPEKIIDPIKSRCNVCEFKKLSGVDIKVGVRSVASRAKIKLEIKDLKTIIESCNGDLRTAINMLEKVKDGVDINSENVFNQKLLKLSLEELIDLSFHEDPDKLLRKIYTEILENKDYKGLVKVAAADYKMALMTNKVLQIQDLIVGLKNS